MKLHHATTEELEERFAVTGPQAVNELRIVHGMAHTPRTNPAKLPTGPLPSNRDQIVRDAATEWYPSHWRLIVTAICIVFTLLFIVNLGRLEGHGHALADQWRADNAAIDKQIEINERNAR